MQAVVFSARDSLIEEIFEERTLIKLHATKNIHSSYSSNRAFAFCGIHSFNNEFNEAVEFLSEYFVLDTEIAGCSPRQTDSLAIGDTLAA